MKRKPAMPREASAREFLRGVAERLGLDPSFVFPGYEDLYYYMWRERRLPANVDPFDSRLEDPLERERLMRIFTQGLTEVVWLCAAGGARFAHGTLAQRTVGFCAPSVAIWFPAIRPWAMRLPLDSQPWASANDYPDIFPPDPTQPFPPLASYAQIRFQVDPHEP